MDKGPWEAVRYVDKGWGIWSDDFEHDVCLFISGDFADEDQQRQYAEWLAGWLNRTVPDAGEGRCK